MDYNVTFPGEQGPLAGVLAVPEGSGPFPAIVVCHPHPQYGGSLDNNVVYAIVEGAYLRGIASLRFNFRGVGQSAGKHDGGAGEQNDTRAALEFLAAQEQVDAGRLGLAGYSFGARVSMAALPSLPQVRALALVSPPLRNAGGLLAGAALPKLLAVGDRDNAVAAPDLERFAAGMEQPFELHVVPGVDHFWRRFEPFLADTVGGFLAANLTGRA